MEYILNETPIRTTNSFGLNNIKLDLDIPSINKLNDISINYPSFKEEKGYIKTNIGLEYNKHINVDINIDEVVTDNIYIDCNFDSDILVSKINLNFNNGRANIIMRFKSSNTDKNINHANISISSTNSEGNITIVNLLNDDSYSFIDIDSVCIDSNIRINFIDLGGSIKISRLDSELNGKSNYYLGTIYMGKNNDIIDTNYYIKNKDSSISKIDSEGVLDDRARKNYKGIIDFISGASGSIGKEIENVILLSDEAISRSLPMLLCGEENVTGAHGVSTGKIDKDKLFYLMSRGLSKKESEKLIIEASYNKILKNIPDEDVVNEILNYISKKCR